LSNEGQNFGIVLSATRIPATGWSNPHFLWALFKLVQIGVGRRMSQSTTHCNNLAFVVEGMGQNMMEDECRSAEGPVSIGEMKFRIGVELLIRQA